MSPPEDDVARIEALVREGNQRVAGEILALRTRLVDVADAVNELRERSGMAPAAPKQKPRNDALRAPLIDLTERLEKVTESVRELESVRAELGKAGEAIGDRVGERADRSFRRLEDALSAMRMQLDSVSQQVRTRPEAEFAASLRQQLEHVTSALRADVEEIGDDMRAEVKQLAEALRREISIEVMKELEGLREPVQSLREHATALRQISGLEELAVDLTAASRHLEALDGHLAAFRDATRDEGARAAELLAIAEERFSAMLAAAEQRILEAVGVEVRYEDEVEESSDEAPSHRRRLFRRHAE